METQEPGTHYYRHNCGQPLIVTFHHNGYQLFPRFRIAPGHFVVFCPYCGRKLNLNFCTQEGWEP